MTTHEINERATRIRLVVTDVDGVLTDGGVFYGRDGEVMKRFSIRDGMGVERLREKGIDVGIVTGEKSESVMRRAEKLGIQIVYLFCKDKPAAIREIMEQHRYSAAEIAYIGDDVNDIEAMKLVGLNGAPSDAFGEVREEAHYVCRRPGGHGAFREFAEMIIEAQKDMQNAERKAFGFGVE
ncbi:MAG TPA: HAD-IIIA family hydrolase [Candidatus Kapabacteria bacterium]|nr:HAD-IIIA family hydrolase [Candidatus Kapabacteria bacterium]